MTNEEILSRFEPNCEYPSYYHESNIEQAMDLARQDAREQVINELVGIMTKYRDGLWAETEAGFAMAGNAVNHCIHKAKSILNQQGEETKK